MNQSNAIVLIIRIESNTIANVFDSSRDVIDCAEKAGPLQRAGPGPKGQGLLQRSCSSVTTDSTNTTLSSMITSDSSSITMGNSTAAESLKLVQITVFLLQYNDH